ncbi:MFS transporter [Microscilla marina]|uniref:Quinolone resistence NorA protein n=1 Tax=Microscilla marina ATCC 23134 TaxID=313606 RepID=A1ZQV8_MICM2|nr:MFS transporter [Microscilla marina]EAY27263.1 quinolone resistence NorA protein [Microscilla marina ATCC 23134]
MRHKETLWTRDFVLFCLSYLLMAAGFYFLLPVLPLYVTQVLEEDKTKIGYIIGLYALSALLIRPFSGYALDTFGRRKVYIISMVLYAFSMFLYSYATTFLLLLSLRFLHGFAWGMVTTGGGTIPADLVPARRRGEGIGYFGLSVTLSMALGPLAGLWILGNNNFSLLFYIGFGVSIASLILAYMVKYPSIAQATSESKQVAPAPRKKGQMFEAKASHASVVVFLFGFAYASIFAFAAVYGTETGVGHSGMFFLLLAIGVSISRPYAGKLMDKKGPQQIMLLSFILGFVGFLLLSATGHSLIVYLTAGFIIGLGCGSIIPTLQTMVMNMVIPERRGVANATYYAAVDLGIGLGSIILGYVANWASTAQMFQFCALMFVFAGIYFFSMAIKHYLRNSIALN